LRWDSTIAISPGLKPRVYNLSSLSGFFPLNMKSRTGHTSSTLTSPHLSWSRALRPYISRPNKNVRDRQSSEMRQRNSQPQPQPQPYFSHSLIQTIPELRFQADRFSRQIRRCIILHADRSQTRKSENQHGPVRCLLDFPGQNVQAPISFRK
jgi:hypothetical protein